MLLRVEVTRINARVVLSEEKFNSLKLNVSALAPNRASLAKGLATAGVNIFNGTTAYSAAMVYRLTLADYFVEETTEEMTKTYMRALKGAWITSNSGRWS